MLLLVGFLARAPQKQPTFLASDDKQDDASDMQFFEVFRNGPNWAKKLIFLLILHTMRDPPRICQMKDLIKIYICGKFHQYSICGCEIKNVKVFCTDSVSMEMAPFYDFFGPYSPKYCLILLKLSP